jgi:putative peptidoglycan lipid II flippase
MLAGFSLGLPAFAVFLYCVRAFHARRNTRTPFWLNLFENTLNVVLVVPFIAAFGQVGLSLAYSAAYWIAAVAAVVVLNRHVRGLLTWRSLAMFARGTLVAVLVIAAVLAVFRTVRPQVGPVVEIAVSLGVAVVVFALATWVLKPHGFADTIQDFREGFARRAGRLRR